MIVPMTKVEVLGSKRLLEGALDVLQDAGVVHVSDAPLEDSSGQQILERLDRSLSELGGVVDSSLLERIAERLREMSRDTPASVMAREENRTAASHIRDELDDIELEVLEKRTDELYDRYRELARHLEHLQGELAVAERYSPAFLALADLIAGTDVTPDKGLIRRAVVLESGAHEILAGLADIVNIVTDETGHIYRAPVKGGRQAVLLIYPEEYDDRIGRMLGDEGFEELQVPVAYRQMSLTEAAEAFQARMEALPAEIDAGRGELNRYLGESAPQIKGLLAQVVGRLEYSRQTDKLAVSDRIFTLQGYIPKSDYDELKDRVDKEFGGALAVTDLGLEPGEEDRVPTKLKNPGFLKDFEVLLSLLPPARYRTVDATPFIAIGFPLLFGLMLGDILYALFVLGMGWLLRATLGRRIEMVRAGSTVLLACGLSTLFFGFFYGEFGGDIKLGLSYWIFDRHHDLNTFLGVALGVGFVHVQIGLILNAWKNFKNRHIRHAIAAIGFMIALIGLLLVALNFTGLAGAAVMTPAYVLMGAGVAMILWGENFNPLGVLHILSYAGNIFSYARLMAIGLASVMLAVVANEFLRTAPLLLGLFAALFFHALNFALGVFGPSIHSLRLHYVEFFGKFYEPQGTVFRPFRKIGGEEV